MNGIYIFFKEENNKEYRIKNYSWSYEDYIAHLKLISNDIELKNPLSLTFRFVDWAILHSISLIQQRCLKDQNPGGGSGPHAEELRFSL